MGHVLHTHPQREKDCKLDIEHVIVDRNEFDNAKALLEAANGIPTEKAVKYLDHGAEMVELLKEIIQLGHSNSDMICKCPDCKNATNIKKLLAKLEATS